MKTINQYIEIMGWPRIIIGLFLLSLYIIAPFEEISVLTSISDTLIRFGMNAILVISLVPMIYSGTGLNFGLPLGVVAGLLGATTSVDLGLTGLFGFFAAIIISLPFAIFFGWGYSQILNRVKGGEMMVATYVGFSSVAFMSIIWLIIPFKSGDMIWAYGGKGLRTTISIERYWQGALNKFFPMSDKIPVGEILFFILIAVLMWVFFKTKSGIEMKAVGANPKFAHAAGINIDRVRTKSVIMSTALAAIGIVVYQESFGFIQLYQAPFYMAFPAIAAILIGGASVNRATIVNVIVGTFLFQGILTMTPTVVNSLMQTDMSGTLRIIISNGMILYALTRKVGVNSGK